MQAFMLVSSRTLAMHVRAPPQSMPRISSAHHHRNQRRIRFRLRLTRGQRVVKELQSARHIFLASPGGGCSPAPSGCSPDGGGGLMMATPPNCESALGGVGGACAYSRSIAPVGTGGTGSSFSSVGASEG